MYYLKLSWYWFIQMITFVPLALTAIIGISLSWVSERLYEGIDRIVEDIDSIAPKPYTDAELAAQEKAADDDL